MIGTTRFHPLWQGVALRSLLALMLLCFVLPATAYAAEVIPPAPAKYFNDYAGVVPPADGDQFNQQLEQFERDTSNQIVVAVYPKMQSDSEIADYTFRVKETWHVGQKDKNNGAILFVFVQDHKLFIQVNYGLEGALPDATCKQIIDQEITPKFRTGDYTSGIRAGITAILAATKGEYKGNGTTAGGGAPDVSSANTTFIYHVFIALIIGFVLFGFVLLFLNYFGGTFYQRHATALTFLDNAYLFIIRLGMFFLLSGNNSSSGGGKSGEGGSSGGGFSGGGGTGGGGGAGGSW